MHIFCKYDEYAAQNDVFSNLCTFGTFQLFLNQTNHNFKENLYDRETIDYL